MASLSSTYTLDGIWTYRVNLMIQNGKIKKRKMGDKISKNVKRGWLRLTVTVKGSVSERHVCLSTLWEEYKIKPFQREHHISSSSLLISWNIKLGKFPCGTGWTYCGAKRPSATCFNLHSDHVWWEISADYSERQFLRCGLCLKMCYSWNLVHESIPLCTWIWLVRKCALLSNNRNGESSSCCNER